MMVADDYKGKKAITNYSTIKVYDKKDIPKIKFNRIRIRNW